MRGFFPPRHHRGGEESPFSSVKMSQLDASGFCGVRGAAGLTPAAAACPRFLRGHEG